ncbi:MAG: peptide chain release factor 1 [Bacillota bacterium]
MFEKLDKLKERYNELNELIAKPEIVAKQDEWRKLVKEHSALVEIIETYEKYLEMVSEMEKLDELIKSSKDKDMAELAEMEYYELKDKKEELVEEIKQLLIPKDPMDDNNVIIEIRSGAGGEEASLFGQVIRRMYYRFAERLKWKVEEIDIKETELGGIKEATFMIAGKGAYAKMKYESGVHRVQRVPETESQGRVHTSTITVAVLPEVEDIDVDLNEKDLKIDTFRSGGAGGQHVNTTDSAVRMTHIPTGIVVECQDERSQIKNKDKALKVMKSRLYDHYKMIQEKEYAQNRKSQVGRGDRSERIRTYNYSQGRVTDHRIGMTLYSLENFLDGDIFSMVEALSIAAKNEQLLNSEL